MKKGYKFTKSQEKLTTLCTWIKVACQKWKRDTNLQNHNMKKEYEFTKSLYEKGIWIYKITRKINHFMYMD